MLKYALAIIIALCVVVDEARRPTLIPTPENYQIISPDAIGSGLTPTDSTKLL